MKTLMTVPVRNNAATWGIGCLGGLGLLPAIFVGINIFVPDDNPFQSLNSLWVLLTLVFGGLVTYLVLKSRRELQVGISGQGYLRFEIATNAEPIVVENPSRFQPLVCWESAGKGQVRKLYFKIFDGQGKNALTLSSGIGLFSEPPPGFKEIEESALDAQMVYDCPKLREVYDMLRKNFRKE